MTLHRHASGLEHPGQPKAAQRRERKQMKELHWRDHRVGDFPPLGHTQQKPHGASKVANRTRKVVNKAPNAARQGRRQAKDSYQLTQRRRSNVSRNGVLEDEDYDDREDEEEEEDEEESASNIEHENGDTYIEGDLLVALTPKFDELKKLIQAQDERSDTNAKEITELGQMLKELPGQYKQAILSTTEQLMNGGENNEISAAERAAEVPGTVNPNDMWYHRNM
ncbi:hypothetical protein FALBO_5839 [Fusarium albosuccineum]|uniref:Uncharacterized protein n=1 Tax=Fusarium albosuccineum TaxID=1237068 RepID=A0A8H4LCT5_9HYPO|nr:hypothetical protein FALBO_5839 [Fusarium albosuccineum]